MAHILKYFAVLLSFAVLSEAFTLDFDHMEKTIREKRDLTYNYPAPEQCGKTTPKENQLCLYGTPKKPTQLAMVNTTSNTAIIMEARARQVVFVDKNYTIILDGQRSKGSYTANTPPVDSEKMQEFASGYNISLNYCLNEHNAVDLKDFGPKTMALESGSTKIENAVKYITKTFGINFYYYITGFIKGEDNSVVMGVVNAFRNLINERLKFLIPIFPFVTKGWLLLKGGALDVFTIIKGIADFVSKMPYKKLILLPIIIPLTVLVVSLNGLFSFVVILYEMAKKVLLQDILGWLINKVISVFKYLAGMGGWSVFGGRGVFTILYKIVEILYSENISEVIGSGVRYITELVLKFFGYKTENGNKMELKVTEDSQFLFDLFSENGKKDPTKTIKPLIDFALGMLGKKLMTVKSINIKGFVNILCNQSIENGLEMAGKIIKLFAPLNLDNIIKPALAGHFKGAMHLLLADVDPAYVEAILPGISLPPGTTLQTHNDTRALFRLPTEEIIRRIPQLHAISNVLDKTALENYNTTLSKEMKKDRNFDREIRLAIRAHLT
ncbi:uncharacterized protein LOC115888370 isoform X1 [Sitophilus oryzae]|uniref:Uncharacterized protein LOC115888370 isoform X1 n=1 Tax=Sitophilus oryzae TaxID=7048 RepID=A0A6J2YKY2_SITOR|nr:uncharacterized protein LOC115888370 isoform X1 [Sitophilus oryzae]